uniref:Uncharacterized protein n=1 Tax=Oryza meridionalis TaxID=40149 RepID=A0A0E0E0A0_9ORYZ
MCAYAITASSPASSPAGHELASLSVLASSTSPSPTYKRPPSPHELVLPSLPFLHPTTHFVEHHVGVLQLLPGSTTAAELRHSAVPRAIIVTSPSSEAPPVEVTVDMPSGGLSLRFFWKNGTLMRHRCSRPSSEAPPVEVTVDMPSGGLSLRFFWKNGTLMRHRCSRPHQFGRKPFRSP